MKFMVNWSMNHEGWLPILEVFSSMTPEQRADVGDGVKMIGRWHDTNSRSGVAIMETTDLAALNRYLGQWNPFMDLDVSPVLDDEETAALAKDVLADHNGCAIERLISDGTARTCRLARYDPVSDANLIRVFC